MAKTQKGFETDGSGRVREFAHKVTKAQRASEAQLIGWTPGPQNAWQRFKRNAVG